MRAAHVYVCPKSPEKGHTGTAYKVGEDGEKVAEGYTASGYLDHAARCDDAFATLTPEQQALIVRQPARESTAALTDEQALDRAAARKAQRSAPAAAAAAESTEPDVAAIVAAVMAALKR